jgi:hypothetical protein
MNMANRTAESVDRQVVAAEVLELGEALFDEVLDVVWPNV